MRALLDFDDAGADDDHPARGVTVGDIRAWYDHVEQIEREHGDYVVRANANVCELNREIDRLKILVSPHTNETTRDNWTYPHCSNVYKNQCPGMGCKYYRWAHGAAWNQEALAAEAAVISDANWSVIYDCWWKRALFKFGWRSTKRVR